MANAPFNRTVLPAPGDDATPFLLRCYVKPAPFRLPSEFAQNVRPIHEEFKLFVWRTATLREIAALIHHASPNISSPQSLHAFRLCYFHSGRGRWHSRDAGEGVTRVSPESFEELLPTHKRPAGLDERSAARTLEDLQVVEGDVLDVIVFPDASAVPHPHFNAGGTGGLSIRGAARGGPPPLGAGDVPSAALGDAHPWGPGPSNQPDRDFHPRSAGSGSLAGRFDARRQSARDAGYGQRNERADPQGRDADRAWGAKPSGRNNDDRTSGWGGGGGRDQGQSSGGWGDAQGNGKSSAGARDAKADEEMAAGWGDDADEGDKGGATRNDKEEDNRETRRGEASGGDKDKDEGDDVAMGWG